MTEATRYVVLTAAYAAVGALTVALSYPTACGPREWHYDTLQRAHWADCAVEQSAINGIVWPLYWITHPAVAAIVRPS